jgi:antitoxin HicB
MKRQEHLAEVEEVAIRVRVENLKNGRYLGTSPDVPGLVAGGRSVAETVEIAQGLARKIVESCLEQGDPLPRVPEQGSVEARIPRSCFCLLNGTPRRIFLGSCPPSQNVWFPIRPSRCGSHEVWRHPQTGRKVTLPHHSGDMAEGTLRAILREAGNNVSDFLKA